MKLLPTLVDSIASFDNAESPKLRRKCASLARCHGYGPTASAIEASSALRKVLHQKLWVLLQSRLKPPAGRRPKSQAAAASAPDDACTIGECPELLSDGETLGCINDSSLAPSDTDPSRCGAHQPDHDGHANYARTGDVQPWQHSQTSVESEGETDIFSDWGVPDCPDHLTDFSSRENSDSLNRASQGGAENTEAVQLHDVFRGPCYTGHSHSDRLDWWETAENLSDEGLGDIICD